MTRSVKAALSLIAGIALAGCTAKAESLDAGVWRLHFDKRDGKWTKLEWRGKTAGENKKGIAPFDFGPDWPGKIKEFPLPDLVTHEAKSIPSAKMKTTGPLVLEDFKKGADGKTVIMNYRCGSWKATEKLEFGAKGDPDLLSRSLTLTYTPERKNGEPAVLANVIFNFPIEREGRFLFPGKQNPKLNDGPKEIAKLPKKFKEEAHWVTIPPFLLEQEGARSLCFVPDGMMDLGNSRIVLEEDSGAVQTAFRSAGWAYPDEPQEIGPVYVKAYEGGLDATLRGGVWRLYDELGWKVPQGRPDWLRDAVIYAFHPGGSADGAWRDLGGFDDARKELIPRLKLLGFNTIWTLPIEIESVYHPQDYYKIDPKLGDAEAYRAMVDSAHDAGMKVWQDIVAHGGRPLWGAQRGNKPWELVFDKDGNALNYWCFDYGNPSWRKYMADVARHYMKEFELDGFRMDAPDGSHIQNWRRKDFPNLEKVPANVPEDWWRESLKGNGGAMPPLPYSRASVCRREGGLEMIKAVRGAVKEINPEGAVLTETTVMPYSQVADLSYDMAYCYYFLRDVFFKLSSEDFAQGLARWLEQSRFAEVKGSLKMRYVESHDSFHIRQHLGVAASRAATALTFLVEGVPMIYQDSDIGQGVFLKKMIALRTALPELRRGEAEYMAAEAQPKCVFSCVRTFNGLASVALINFSPEAVDASFRVPELVVSGKRDFTAWDCWNGGELAAIPKDGFIKRSLPPWGIDVVAFRPRGEATPFIPEERPVERTAQTRKADAELKAEKKRLGQHKRNGSGLHAKHEKIRRSHILRPPRSRRPRTSRRA